MNLIENVLQLFLTLLFGFTVVTFTIALYEWTNSNGRQVKQVVSPSTLWLAFRLIVLEYLSLLATLILYPLGWLNLPEGDESKKESTPVILLHGLFLNRACWLAMKLRLRLKGIKDVHTIYLPPWKDVETLTEMVARKVDTLRHTRKIEKVHLIGHSMGAILARNYTQIRGGAEKVDRCILIGAPNGGSKLAPFAATSLGESLVPGSDFLTNLNKQPFPESVSYLNLYSRHDNIIIPAEKIRIEELENIEFTGIGHDALLYSNRIFKATFAFLTSTDHDDPADQQPQTG